MEQDETAQDNIVGRTVHNDRGHCQDSYDKRQMAKHDTTVPPILHVVYAKTTGVGFTKWTSSVLSPLMCAMLTPGNATLACTTWQRGDVCSWQTITFSTCWNVCRPPSRPSRSGHTPTRAMMSARSMDSLGGGSGCCSLRSSWRGTSTSHLRRMPSTGVAISP